MPRQLGLLAIAVKDGATCYLETSRVVAIYPRSVDGYLTEIEVDEPDEGGSKSYRSVERAEDIALRYQALIDGRWMEARRCP